MPPFFNRMSHTLIITEKPNASKKIAEALADKKPKKEVYQKKVPYYTLEHDGKKIVIASAVGHIFGLDEKEKSKGFKYPVFDIEWKPSYEVGKGADFTKKYAMALKKLTKDADEFIVATDYDVEGEVIGLNVLRYICKQKDAKRMKFSTLTKGDLQKSYDNALPTIDWGQARAGETRHKLDWFYGINISRGLTSSIKKAGMFKILSSGRVQGPALKILAEREKEIKAFKPEPFWQIEIVNKVKKQNLSAWHVADKFWKKNEADNIVKKVKKEKEAKVDKIERKQTKQAPPIPFDLTTLQTEAFRCHNISPKQILDIAQELYTRGLISYPRTSSNILPPTIGFKNILKQLQKQTKYNELAAEVLKTNVTPNNGKKTDPAHPAIYPTGIKPSKLDQREEKIYDLIVRRFLATFGESAVRETMKILFLVADETFISKGTRTLEKGWHNLYGPYVTLEEVELPAIEEGTKVEIKKLTRHDKETQPPKRYTESSIIRDLEKRNLGTKATRATIIDTLHKRNYVTGKPIGVTELGLHIVELLGKYCPKLQDEEMTRHFEIETEEVQQGKKKMEDVIDEAKNIVTDIMKGFKKKEKEIGADLVKTFTETRDVMNTLGPCPKCKEGTVMIKRGKFGRFAACDKYPDCKTTISLPSSGMIKGTEKVCDADKYPMVTVIRRGKKPQEVCINPDCPKKEVKEVKEKPCPTCKEGKLVLRKSLYGSFLGCNRYPKCRHTEKLEKKS